MLCVVTIVEIKKNKITRNPAIKFVLKIQTYVNKIDVLGNYLNVKQFYNCLCVNLSTRSMYLDNLIT
jgi:homospermidine synthase